MISLLGIIVAVISWMTSLWVISDSRNDRGWRIFGITGLIFNTFVILMNIFFLTL